MRNCSASLLQFFSAGRCFGEGRQNLLDGADATFQAQVVGAVDGAHAALPDQFLDAVAIAKDGARFKYMLHASPLELT